MDFGFAPGNGDHHKLLRDMLTRRASTTLVTQPKVLAVHDLVNHLDSTVTRPPPIDDIVIGTHAGGRGYLNMKFARNQPAFSDFEGAEATMNGTASPITIPDSLIGYTSGAPITHSVHFKGCNVGKDRFIKTKTPKAPFLVKMKEAFGGHVNVTAPKHFHGLETVRGLGVFEYMAYEFHVTVKPTLANRRLVGPADGDALRALFVAAKHPYIDGTKVADDVWNAPLIPDNVTQGRGRKVPAPLGRKIGTRSTVDVHQQFRVETWDVDWTLKFPTVADVPTGSVGQLSALRADLLTHNEFTATHPFPVYERLEFPTFTDFVDGMFWSFTVSGRKLVCKGLLFVYTVLLAIVDRTTGNLIFNFYPNAGSSAPAVTNGLVVTDRRFFGSS